MTWDRRHLLDVDEMSVDDLSDIMRGAERMQQGLSDLGEPLEDELCDARVALLFAEPSTRTRISFEVAARNLAAETLVLEAASSSLVKGESLVDTVRNLDAIGIEMLVLRHHRAGAPWVAARYFGGAVINAGDGWHAHPTQALLDLLTLREAFGIEGGEAVEGSLRGRKVVVVGDVLHSRVARSNIWTLTAAGAELWLCGPSPLLRGFDELSRSMPADRRFTVTDDFDAALRDADAVMALRVQRERMAKGAVSFDDYVTGYQVTEARLGRARPGAWFLHPGPVNEGIEVTRGVARGPRSLVLEQVRNGVPIRMSVLARLQRPVRPVPDQASSPTRDLSSALR